MTKHALLSPSSAERWTHCPASAAVAAAYPRESSQFSAEGTAAHQLAAWCLEEGKDALAFLGRVIEADGFTFTVDEGMAGYVQGYLDRTRAWLDFAGAVLFVEQAISIESITGEADATGTSDAVVIVPGANPGEYDLVVRDLKYGRGVPVDAFENKQLVTYAAGALEQFGIAYDFPDHAQVHMEIDQPRREHTSRFTLTIGALRERAAAISAAAKVALATPADGKRVAGDWCRFCPARAVCETRAKWVADSMAEGFENLEAPGPEDDGERLARYLGRIEAIRAWCSSVETDALARLAKGGTIPGWKLVSGRAGDRKWTDEEHAATALISFGAHREQIFTAPKLKSPAQIEKLIPKGSRVHLDALVTRGEGKPSLAPESDPRPALTSVGTSADGFTAVDETASIL